MSNRMGAFMEEASRDVIEACQNGRIEQFKTLYDLYKDFVYNLSYKMLQDHQDSADLTQAIFIKVFQKISSFKFQSKFSTWLYRVAFNQTINFKKNDPPHDMAEEIETILDRKSMHNYEDYERQLENAEKVRFLLEQLNHKQRLLLILKEAYAMEYDEIAEITGLLAGTVKSSIHRAKEQARKTLRTLLEPEIVK